ncbi:hypothetical protein [Corynebacterium macclintockiae]|uniref:hypothetical protein n=1 Tax=Corynebacterium macclintockiae TaxID=2913501 RepID=UPI003EBEB135
MTISRTYELPAPSKTSDNFSVWRTNHSVEIDGCIDNDGSVLNDHGWGVITVDTHEGEELALDYDEARRVALALLAAAEEAETKKENTP